MKLGIRARLALRLVALLVPFGVFVAWLVVTQRARATAESTAAAVVARMDERTRDACEERPDAWPDEPDPTRPRARRLVRRAWEVVPFDATFHGRRRFPSELAEALLGGETYASRVAGRGRRAREEIAVRMPWTDGPCAVILVRRPVDAPRLAWLRALRVTLPVALAATLVAVLAVGPIVRRIRKLTAAAEGKAPLPADGSTDELGELSRAFGQSRAAEAARVAELVARDETLRRYVASTTHDVMLPVTVLAGHLTDLERAARSGAALDPKLLASALAETDYLAALVANLGAAAKLDAGEPHLTRHATDLGALVVRVHERHAPLARRRGVELAHAVPEAPLVAQADPTLLEQAVSNLVHNAVRYVPAGGHVAVVLERDGASSFRLRVLDDGPGVPEAELPRLGERGYRGTDEARTRGVPGSGLGLAIARDVAARHGYALELSRPADGGLLATISGPLHTATKD